MVIRYSLNHINIRAEYKRRNNFKYLLRRDISQIYKVKKTFDKSEIYEVYFDIFSYVTVKKIR